MLNCWGGGLLQPRQNPPHPPQTIEGGVYCCQSSYLTVFWMSLCPPHPLCPATPNVSMTSGMELWETPCPPKPLQDTGLCGEPSNNHLASSVTSASSTPGLWSATGFPQTVQTSEPRAPKSGAFYAVWVWDGFSHVGPPTHIPYAGIATGGPAWFQTTGHPPRRWPAYGG